MGSEEAVSGCDNGARVCGAGWSDHPGDLKRDGTNMLANLPLDSSQRGVSMGAGVIPAFSKKGRT